MIEKIEKSVWCNWINCESK